MMDEQGMATHVQLPDRGLVRCIIICMSAAVIALVAPTMDCAPVQRALGLRPGSSGDARPETGCCTTADPNYHDSVNI